MDHQIDKYKSSSAIASRGLDSSANEGQDSKLLSRLPGFYELPFRERQRIAALFANEEVDRFQKKVAPSSLTPDLCDTFIENAIGAMSLPLGVATNFVINGEDIIVPMAVEESSVVAAASHGAKLVRAGGGFKTSSSQPVMTAQIQLLDIPYKEEHSKRLEQFKFKILEYANRGFDRLIQRGGGAQDITLHVVKELRSIVFHLHVHTGDAMGANIVNTMAEKIAPLLAEIFDTKVGLRILTNLCDKRTATSECWIPASAFSTKKQDGRKVVAQIEQAYLFAYYDPYRATTHNKGVMNGIDSVTMATGNDWRAVEAGAHAWCARGGQYRPMTEWKSLEDHNVLYGKIELPLSLGTVGGVTKLHPAADISLKIMGQPSARKLAEITVSVGLAQNLAALRALSSEGIQYGHMGLHHRNIEMLQRQRRK